MEKNLKIGVCTLSIGETYKQYTRYTLQNKKIYCEKHGYTLIEDNKNDMVLDVILIVNGLFIIICPPFYIF